MLLSVNWSLTESEAADGRLRPVDTLFTCSRSLVGEKFEGQTTGRLLTDVDIEKDARAVRDRHHSVELCVCSSVWRGCSSAIVERALTSAKAT